MIIQEVAQRKSRLDAIRASMKGNAVFQKNTIAVENKIQKRRKRKESLEVTEDLA